MENEKKEQQKKSETSLVDILLEDLDEKSMKPELAKIEEASLSSEVSADTEPVVHKTLSEILESQKRDDAILSVRNLHISFKNDDGLVHAVRGVSFDLYKGETLCIVGESGSGKSVTSKTIMGILPASGVIDEGSVMYEGEDLTKIDETEFHRIRGHKIGMIFQDPLSSLNPIMKVGKQITEAMLVNKNHLKKMKNDIIAKEEAAYKNNKVKRNYVYSTVKRAIDASDSEFNKAIVALELKLSEADMARDSYAKGSSEYEAADKAFEELKTQNAAEKKELLKKKKAEHDRLAKEGKVKTAEADRVYKEHLPALKAALTAKKKEADIKIKEYKDAETKKHNEILEPLKKELAQAKAGKDTEKIAKVNADIKAENKRFKELFTITRAQAKEQALKVMKEVGIPQPEQRFKQYPFEFSGGMRQRIVIAIALTANPDVLICDEPTTALDVTIQAQILELINRLKKERNMSIIFITHDLGVVANMADRVAVMYAGKIVEVGTANEIFYDPRHPYTWALLSSIPDIDSKEKLEAIPGTPPNLVNPPKGDAFAARNKYAMQIDFEQEPPFFRISDTHYAATWLLDERAPKTEKPKIVSQRIKASLERAGVTNE